MVRRSAPDFKQMRCEAVAQGVGMDLISESGSAAAWRQAAQVTLGVMGFLPVCQRLPGNNQTSGFLRQSIQIVPKLHQQFGAEHDIAVFPALSHL